MDLGGEEEDQGPAAQTGGDRGEPDGAKNTADTAASAPLQQHGLGWKFLDTLQAR